MKKHNGLLMGIVVAALVFLAFSSCEAQGIRCTRQASVTTTGTGYIQLLPNPSSTIANYHICSILVQLTQGATPSNYQITSCTDNTCATQLTLSPLWFGHASAVETYTYLQTPSIDIPVLRGYGVYLYLPGTPTNVAAQIFYGEY